MLDIGRMTGILSAPIKTRSPSDVCWLLNELRTVGFFRKIEHEFEHDKIAKGSCQFMGITEFGPGEELFAVGDKADKVFIVIQGTVELFAPVASEDPSLPHTSFSFKVKSEVAEAFCPQGRPASDSVNDLENPVKIDHCRLKSLFSAEIVREKEHFQQFVQENKRPFKLKVRSLRRVGDKGVGEVLGEHCLFNEWPRLFSAVSPARSTLLVLDKEHFLSVFNRVSNKKLSEFLELLYEFPLFRLWTRIALSRLCPYFTPVHYSRNQYIYNESDPVSSLYFVTSGEFQMTKSILKETKQLIRKSLNSRTDQILRLCYGKSIRKKSNIQLLIKGKFEILGLEEVMGGQGHYLSSCQCISSEATLFRMDKTVLYTQELINKAGLPDTWSTVRARASTQQSQLSKRSRLQHQLSVQESPQERTSKPPNRKNDPPRSALQSLLQQRRPRRNCSAKPVERPRAPGPSKLLLTQKRVLKEEKRSPNGLYACDIACKNYSVHRRGAPPNFLFSYRNRGPRYPEDRIITKSIDFRATHDGSFFCL